MVVEEPLDVGYHRAHHGLHGWAGSQVLSLSLSFDTLGQLTDPADVQKQRSVLLAEGRYGVDSFSRHCLTWQCNHTTTVTISILTRFMFVWFWF